MNSDEVLEYLKTHQVDMSHQTWLEHVVYDYASENFPNMSPADVVRSHSLGDFLDWLVGHSD